MAVWKGLRGANADDWEWQLRGACRSADPDLFFPAAEEPRAERPVREAAAKRVCAACPVLAQCREHALATRERYGVWGGLSEADRDGWLVSTTTLNATTAPSGTTPRPADCHTS